MADFRQPEGYEFIDDGRLLEEQPGMPFVCKNGMRIAQSALDVLGRPELPVPEVITPTPEDEREHNRMAVAVINAASHGIDPNLTLSERLKVSADNMASPGFVDTLRVELETLSE